MGHRAGIMKMYNKKPKYYCSFQFFFNFMKSHQMYLYQKHVNWESKHLSLSYLLAPTSRYASTASSERYSHEPGQRRLHRKPRNILCIYSSFIRIRDLIKAPSS